MSISLYSYLSFYSFMKSFFFLTEYHETVPGGSIMPRNRVAQNKSEGAETGSHQPTGTDLLSLSFFL